MWNFVFIGLSNLQQKDYKEKFLEKSALLLTELAWDTYWRKKSGRWLFEFGTMSTVTSIWGKFGFKEIQW